MLSMRSTPRRIEEARGARRRKIFLTTMTDLGAVGGWTRFFYSFIGRLLYRVEGLRYFDILGLKESHDLRRRTKLEAFLDFGISAFIWTRLVYYPVYSLRLFYFQSDPPFFHLCTNSRLLTDYVIKVFHIISRNINDNNSTPCPRRTRLPIPNQPPHARTNRQHH